MIKIGCCSYNFRGLGLEESLRLTSQLGFRETNIGAYDDSFPVPPSQILERPEATGREIRAACARYGLDPIEFFICAVNIGGGDRVWPNDPDNSRRGQMLEVFKKVCACAAEGGMKNIMGVPGLPGLNPDPDKGLSVSAETLGKMLGISLEHGIRLTVEPHTGSIAMTPEKALSLLKLTPGLALSLDYAHFIGTGYKPEDIAPLHKRTYHIHGKPANKNNTKCLFYDGEDFFTPLIRDLIRLGWDGVISAECMYPADSPDILSHPAFQTILVAGHIGRILKEASISVPGNEYGS